VVSLPEFGPPDDRRVPTTTPEGQRRFVGDDPIAFDLLAEDAWTGLDVRTQDEYDEARVNYHSELIIVETPTGRSGTTRQRGEAASARSSTSAAPVRSPGRGRRRRGRR